MGQQETNFKFSTKTHNGWFFSESKDENKFLIKKFLHRYVVIGRIHVTLSKIFFLKKFFLRIKISSFFSDGYILDSSKLINNAWSRKELYSYETFLIFVILSSGFFVNVSDKIFFLSKYWRYSRSNIYKRDILFVD